jgi:hypothetical protein
MGLLLSAAAVSAANTELTREEQVRIVENYLYVTGRSEVLPEALAELDADLSEVPIKSGTPAILEFLTNYNRLDKDLRLSTALQNGLRPVLDLTYDSPAGHFKIHYTVTGDSAVYYPGVDMDQDGVPDYVNGVAAIADSVYENIVSGLGFPPPPVDTLCEGGGDARYDIYILALPSTVFGLTYADTACAEIDTTGIKNLMVVPAFLEIDNDYQHISAYRNRPLDAVRVTVAHEFFHAIQFGMDWTEWENLYWMEMSATWMEEHLYDHINDFYAYLPFFYETPRTSIQQFAGSLDFHPYASVVFPLFLSEYYSPEIIRSIWEYCADLGVGGDFLVAAQLAIDSISGGTESFGTAFAEFALWNYFTGSRASWAPDGVGYSERGHFSTEIPYDSMAVHRRYPLVVPQNQNLFKPEHNGVSYVVLEETRSVQEDRFWECLPGTRWSICGDSSEAAEVIDTTLNPYDVHDSVFAVDGGFESLQLVVGDDSLQFPWGLNVIYRLEDDPDSFMVDRIMLPSAPCTRLSCFTLFRLETDRVNRFRSITLVFSPGSPVDSLYRFRETKRLAYGIDEVGQIDSNLISIASAVLTPYPNPAVADRMADFGITFRFQVPTDTASFPLYYEPYLVIDLFSVAGERVATLVEDIPYSPSAGRDGDYELTWDMTNQGGREVASGVYIAYARLYADNSAKLLLAEDKVKVAVIR